MRLDIAELVRQFPRAGLVADAERSRIERAFADQRAELVVELGDEVLGILPRLGSVSRTMTWTRRP
jgi:hypothetical protein